MQATLNCPLELLLSLAAEYDLMSSWNKYALDPTVLAEPTFWEKYVYSGVWLPFPFPHMDLTVRGKGWDLGKVRSHSQTLIWKLRQMHDRITSTWLSTPVGEELSHDCTLSLYVWGRLCWWG